MPGLCIDAPTRPERSCCAWVSVRHSTRLWESLVTTTLGRMEKV